MEEGEKGRRRRTRKWRKNRRWNRERRKGRKRRRRRRRRKRKRKRSTDKRNLCYVLVGRMQLLYCSHGVVSQGSMKGCVPKLVSQVNIGPLLNQ